MLASSCCVLFAGLPCEKYVLNKYNAGFNECANEVSRYLNNSANVDIDVRTKILDHLMNVVQGSDSDDVTQLAAPVLPPVAPSPVQVTLKSPLTTALPQVSQATQMATQMGQTTHGAQMASQVQQIVIKDAVQYQMPQTVQPQLIGGVQLIPIQLANGELAFILPRSGHSTAPQTLSQFPLGPINLPAQPTSLTSQSTVTTSSTPHSPMSHISPKSHSPISCQVSPASCKSSSSQSSPLQISPSTLGDSPDKDGQTALPSPKSTSYIDENNNAYYAKYQYNPHQNEPGYTKFKSYSNMCKEPDSDLCRESYNPYPEEPLCYKTEPLKYKTKCPDSEEVRYRKFHKGMLYRGYISNMEQQPYCLPSSVWRPWF